MDVNFVEIGSLACVGISTYVSLSLKASLAQLELRLKDHVTEAIGKIKDEREVRESKAKEIAEGAYRKASSAQSAARENKACIESLESRVNRAGIPA